MKRLRTIVVAVCAAGLFVYAAWPWLPFSRKRPVRTIVFYGFSILADTMTTAHLSGIPEELGARERRRPRRVRELLRRVGHGHQPDPMGVPAQVALLSLESDADRLADAGVVRAGRLEASPERRRRQSDAVRHRRAAGKPPAIHDFDDLAKPGVRVVHPDPMTSGGANWAIVAEYGSGARGAPGGPRRRARRVLAGVWKNVVAQAASARAARTQFENGFGDALVTYEQEALCDRARGRLARRDRRIRRARSSPSTRSCVVDRTHPTAADRPLVDGASCAFSGATEAQRLFVRVRLPQRRGRSSTPRNPAFGPIDDPFRIARLRRMERAARRDIVDGIWKRSRHEGPR